MKLPIVSWIDIVKLLTSFNFSMSRQSGSHIILVKMTGQQKTVVVVPKHTQIAKGTLLSIISQSGIDREQFLNLLRR